MSDLPQEAVEAIKLSRADAVKMVADQLLADAAGDVSTCERRVIERADAFRKLIVARARELCGDLLRTVANTLRIDGDLIGGTTPYRVYENGDDSGTVAEVVFSECQNTFDARLRIMVSVPLDDITLAARRHWAEALVARKNARERDLRMGAMKREARDILIKAALSGSPEGEAVVASIRALAALNYNPKADE